MNFSIKIIDGNVIFEKNNKTTEHTRNTRNNKGKSLLNIDVSDYTIIDIETTGLDSTFDEIIELAALKIRNNQIVDRFQTFVKPENEIDEFITELTGITNEMVKDAPQINEIINSYYKFLSDDIIIGHNVNFDINFLYDISEISNDFIDTLRIARRCVTDIKNHKLNTLTNYFKINNVDEHRALIDCNITYELFLNLKKIAQENPELLKEKNHKLKASDIQTTVDFINEDNPFFGKEVVFTGTLERFQRKDAMQIVANLGGINKDRVSKKTNYLVLGNYDYSAQLKNEKSSKRKQAEKYILDGMDIDIISEKVFYEMIEQ